MKKGLLTALGFCFGISTFVFTIGGIFFVVQGVIENKVLQHDETVIELKDHDITIERFFYHTKAEIVITLKQKTCDKQRFEKECLLVYDDVLDSFGLVVPPESLVKIPEDKRPTSLFEETPRKFM